MLVHQFSSVAQLCLALWDPMDCSLSGFPVHQPTPGVCSNSRPLSRWCHPTISASVIPFSSRLQSFPASGSFPMSQFFALGGQSIRVSASTSVHPMTTQDCIYICNCYIFFLDRSHYVMSFLISCNSLYFKVYFIWYEYWYSCFILICLHRISFSCPSL